MPQAVQFAGSVLDGEIKSSYAGGGLARSQDEMDSQASPPK